MGFRAILLLTLVASHLAHANADLDRKYALESIGALRSWDNVDGLFGDYVAAAYKDALAKQTRFRSVDLYKADALFATSKIPYAKAIEDPEVLGQLARSMRVQSLLRTKIFKEGPRYRFTIDWLHAPQMDVLGSDTFSLQDNGSATGGAVSDGSASKEFAGLGDIKAKIQESLNRVFAKVPFVGQVTGRDNADLTVNLGAATGIRRGDTLLIGTLDEVKKHPLLRDIVEWRTAPIAKAEIDSVDDALSFAHIVSQEEGREVARYQKILRVIPKPAPPPQATTPDPEAPKPPSLDDAPKLGFGMASLWTGAFSRQFSAPSTVDATTGASVAGSTLGGGGLLYGAKGSGELWVNREIFLDGDLGFALFGFSQSDASGNTVGSSVSGSVFHFNLNVGYSYLVTGEFFGPRAWVKLGFRSNSYSLPVAIAPEYLSPFGNKSFYLGIGGDLPIRGNIGVKLDFKFGIFNSGGQTDEPNGATTSVLDANINIAGYYRYRSRIHFLLGVDIEATGADFSNGASLSQKTIALVPAVQYLF